MKSCWDVLEIQRTQDLAAIHRARRSLIKRWHPDATTVTEEKAEYTHRCMQINAAFDEAAKFARIAKAHAPKPNQYRAKPVKNSLRPTNFDLATFPAKYFLLALFSVHLLFPIQSLLFGFLVIALLTAVAGATILVGAVDFLFVTAVVNPLVRIILGHTALQRHQRTITSFTLLVLNCVITAAWYAKARPAFFGAKALAISTGISIPLWLSLHGPGEAESSAPSAA